MFARANKKNSFRLSYPLLLLCYLEVLLWTTAVLSSGVGGEPVASRSEDVGYLARETESLKHATAPLQASQSLPGSLDLRGGQPPPQEHRAALRALARAALDRAPAVVTTLRPALALAFLPVLKGVPAPYTGVKALSDAAGFA